MRAASLMPLLAASGMLVSAHAQPPDAAALFSRPDKGHCAACHRIGAPEGTRSDVGPALRGERMRALGKPALRALIEDPTRANPGTVMPPYGRHRILDGAEIAKLVDYLHALP